MGCFMWTNGKQCGAPVSKNGLCAQHLSAAKADGEASRSVPASITKWTPAAIKKHMGMVASSYTASSEFVGGSKAQPHVHNYSNGGAHVKVGNKEHVFLAKHDGSFKKDGWADGIAAVRGRGLNHLLLAMALVLADSSTSGLSDIELDNIIKALPTS